MTLVEIMMVLAIVAVAVGGSLVSFRALRRTTAKSAAARMGAAIRYTYDRAVTTGSYYRIVFDLTGKSYWAERSDNRFYLVRGKEETNGKGRGADEEVARRKREEEERKAKETTQYTGLAAQLQPPPEPPKARFESFKDSNSPKVDLKGVRVRDLYTPRQPEPYREGKAYLYFFPDGHTERALLHVEDTDGDVYSVVVHPLTGRVEVLSGDVPVGREFELDDEGRAQDPR